MQTSTLGKQILDNGSEFHLFDFEKGGTHLVWQKKAWKLNKIDAKHREEGNINSKML